MAERERILVVDDDSAILRLIQLVLEGGGYEVAVAKSAEAARGLAAEREFAVALCDMAMPGESGLDLVRHLCSQDPNLAVLMVTGVDDSAVAKAAVDYGAYGYVVKPFMPSALLIVVLNALQRRRLEIENRRYRERLEELVSERTSELRETVARLEESERALRRSREETIHRLAIAIEARDGDTGSHIVRMGEMCEAVACVLGLPPDRCELIGLASPLHDIGKIGIPDRILRKPDPLTSEEWEVIRGHAEIGYRMLAGSGEELLELAAVMALTHHERMDGSGYPRGLSGGDIPVEGRIAAVVDVFDAVTSNRVYQPARPLDEALAILEAGRGNLFDPEVLDAFLSSVAAKAPRAPVAVSARGSS